MGFGIGGLFLCRDPKIARSRSKRAGSKEALCHDCAHVAWRPSSRAALFQRAAESRHPRSNNMGKSSCRVTMGGARLRDPHPPKAEVLGNDPNGHFQAWPQKSNENCSQRALEQNKSFGGLLVFCDSHLSKHLTFGHRDLIRLGWWPELRHAGIGRG